MRCIASTSAVVVAAALLAACGGGGGATAAGPIPNQSQPTQSTQSLGVTFAGTQTLAKVRRTQDLASVPVTVSVGGVVVGTGTLDANGHAKITFTVAVAPGSTITIVAGKLTVTATLAMGTQATAVLITINADGTISVKSAGDRDGNGIVDANDDEQEDATEDDHGNVTSVNAGSGNVLPANAPFTLTRTCTTLTLTPVGTTVASIKFEEKGSDAESDDAGRVRFEGAFTGPLTFPIASAAARLHIELFDAQHHRLIEVKAPISAFTSGTSTGASPCPSPSAAPSATPSASPSPTATPR
ncbi:MAG TPA: hypothetical protein VE826_10800 [Dongiaceae bacterium]|nr:hypothetical protein [Dongiaceae bacterium]